jgi:hypothetical protein
LITNQYKPGFCNILADSGLYYKGPAGFCQTPVLGGAKAQNKGLKSMSGLIDIENGWVAREDKILSGKFLHQERLLDVITIKGQRQEAKLKESDVTERRLPK